jgi:Rad3-related DNA helicase
VCRGKLSEGIDFSDRDARCVIIIGVPFLELKDPKVVIKKHHLDCLNNQYNQFGTKELQPLTGH